VKKLALAAVLAVALLTIAPAEAVSPNLSPHVFTAKITGATPAILNGTWRLAINKPGFAVNKDGRAAIIGTVTIAGNRVTFRDGAGPLACRGAQRVGTYTWRITGKRLTLSRVSDACVGRRSVFAHAFIKIA
jgi:opacity protein-like surface antigen